MGHRKITKDLLVHPVYDETPEEAHRIIRSLQRRIFHLCMFLAREGLDDEADEYLRTHMEEPAPFEDLW